MILGRLKNTAHADEIDDFIYFDSDKTCYLAGCFSTNSMSE